MINAAEPVDYEAIMKFYEIFTTFALPPNVVIPTYGLAEHTVFVCSGGLQALTVSKTALEKGLINIFNEEELIFDKKKLISEVNAEEHHKIVGCGFPFRGDDVKVMIVNTETEMEQPSLTVGEVWVDSPSKAFGYWGKPELSNHDFCAVIQSSAPHQEQKEDHAGKYLRTGDLGFLYKGELFICGRIKDLIIIGGSNHYPQDIEHSIEQQLETYLRAGCSAAFSLRSEANHTEDIAYVAEVKKCLWCLAIF
jgi:acyl-CoA synthetase (AMP-forming)/AMP-acid ligase II